MTLRVTLLLMPVALLAFACVRMKDVPIEFPTPPPAVSATPLPKLVLKRDSALEAEFAKIAAAAKGKVGVAAVVLETGDAALLNADGQYPMQSVYKLPIAMAVMEKVRRGELDLAEKIGVTKEDFVRHGQRSPLRDEHPDGGEFTLRELISLALVESDGSASDVLIRVLGGTSEVQAYLTQIGIEDIKVVNTEKEIGKDWETQYANWAKPMAAAEILRSLDEAAEHWSPPNKDKELTPSQAVLQLMFISKPGENRIKGMLPANVFHPVAHKTGTGGTQNGITSATNDIGIVYGANGKRIALAVFVSDSPADEKTREAVIAKIAKTTWEKWSR